MESKKTDFPVTGEIGPPVPEGLLNEFRQFVREVPVGRLSKNLRNMVLQQVASDLDALPLDFAEFLEDLQALFDLLDEVEKANRPE